MEDSKKKIDFTLGQHHCTKLFLPAHLVVRDRSHEESKEPNGGTINESKSSQKRKNSGKPDANFGSHMDIDNETLKEIKKAGISPGKVDVAHQKIALQQYEEEQKQKLAKPKKNKEKIEQQKRIQEAKDELKMDDWSSLDTSLLDIEKQKKILEEATHNMKMQEVKRLEEEIIQKIGLQKEEEKRVQEAAAHKKRLQEENAQKQKEEAARQKRLQEKETAQQQREDAARQKRLQEEKRQEEATRRHNEEEAARNRRLQIQQHDEEIAKQKRLQGKEAAQQQREDAAKHKKLQEEAAQHERLPIAQQNKKKYEADKYDNSDLQNEVFYDASNTWLEKEKGSPVDAAHMPSNHDDIAFNDQFDPNHFANQPQENITPVIKTQPSPQQGYKPIKPDPQPSNDNPHNLEVGAMIQFGNPPCYGVIKWIGSLPDTNCVMAGVELVSYI